MLRYILVYLVMSIYMASREELAFVPGRVAANYKPYAISTIYGLGPAFGPALCLSKTSIKFSLFVRQVAFRSASVTLALRAPVLHLRHLATTAARRVALFILDRVSSLSTTWPARTDVRARFSFRNNSISTDNTYALRGTNRSANGR